MLKYTFVGNLFQFHSAFRIQSFLSINTYVKHSRIFLSLYLKRMPEVQTLNNKNMYVSNHLRFLFREIIELSLRTIYQSFCWIYQSNNCCRT